MKALLLTFFVTSNLLTIASSFATARGNSSGGGGDASEVRFNEVRSDILKWINSDGAKDLYLQKELSYGQYIYQMTDILQAKKVIIGFTEDKVFVEKVEKTCKGFLAENKQPHILCNISRFQNTKESEQYMLIHHEYASLVNIENNEGAASDYAISSQITDFLSVQEVLKLAVKKTVDKSRSEVTNCDDFVRENYSNLKAVQTTTGLKNSFDVISSYADILHIQLMIDINQKRIAHEDAQQKFEYESSIRQCADFFGIKVFGE